jgi:nitroimidazol reductase NimA-like FMN-containing flavoprotein (pyridoxamine 5'-phosphate oxidase superfamily)
MSEVEELSYASCRSLLSGGVFGRVGVCTPEGPRILPVNYSVVGEAIVIRTTSDGVVATYGVSAPMVFEVDHVDYEDHRGWSVVATGTGEIVEAGADLALVRRTWEPRPWAGGERPLYVRLPWTELTGRRLGQGWTYTNELPVRRRL